MPENAFRPCGNSFFGNVRVLPWYTMRDLFIAGVPGVLCLWTAVASTVLWGMDVLSFALCIPTTAVCCIFSALCFLLGIHSACTTAPRNCRKAACFSFLQKSILFLPAWTVCAISCVLIVGVFCNMWRLGLAVSSTPGDCYTAFPDGRKIQVSLVKADTAAARPLYKDAAGNLYRPPLRFQSTPRKP